MTNIIDKTNVLHINFAIKIIKGVSVSNNGTSSVNLCRIGFAPAAANSNLSPHSEFTAQEENCILNIVQKFGGTIEKFEAESVEKIAVYMNNKEKTLTTPSFEITKCERPDGLNNGSMHYLRVFMKNGVDMESNRFDTILRMFQRLVRQCYSLQAPSSRAFDKG